MGENYSARDLMREVRHSITHTCRPPTVNPKKKVSKTGPKVCGSPSAWHNEKCVA